MKVQRGAAGRRIRRATTISASNATSPSTPSIRRSRTASPHEVGSIEAGKLADLVLWKPAFFGVKPEMVIKGGLIAWSGMGDANASIPTPQPVLYRPMFGAFGKALEHIGDLCFEGCAEKSCVAEAWTTQTDGGSKGHAAACANPT